MRISRGPAYLLSAIVLVSGNGCSSSPAQLPSGSQTGRSFASVSPSATAHHVLYSFTGGSDGAFPLAAVIADASGNLYGTASGGGNTAGSCATSTGGCGVVFKRTMAGSQTVLHAFTGKPSDGAVPMASLIRDAAGNLYGTTAFGGTEDRGVIFKIAPSGKESVLHSFCSNYPNCSDGSEPVGGLVSDSAGNLYGTTQYGGKIGGACGSMGCGVVFKLGNTGKLHVLHAFAGSPNDGRSPVASLLLQSNVLYGTTNFGGIGGVCAAAGGCGVAFKLSLGGVEKVLHRFSGGTKDGKWPLSSVVFDSNGNLYGTTKLGGTGSSGVVFKIDASGKETVLHNFKSNPDGALPFAGLFRTKKGLFFGTTSRGGTINGTVFKISATGTESVASDFGVIPDGTNPVAGLIQIGSTFYGTTQNGGSNNRGTVFSLP